jgi:HD-GYP domain-containing protein (c-di-GMP phosphodiesterase class II)
MLRVQTTSAQPGMKLALPVYHPAAPGRVLLRSGYELDSRSLSRLLDLRVTSLWVSYPRLAFLEQYNSPEVARRRAGVAGRVRGLFDALGSGAKADLDYPAYASSVTSLAQSLLDEPKAALLIDRIARAGDDELAHAVSVCYLSLLMGLKLGWYLEQQRQRVEPARAREVAPLGVAGMLHDIGYVRMSAQERQRLRGLRDEQGSEHHGHVELGYKFVRGRVPPTVAAAVLHHHQRLDGSGYPQRQTADGRTEAVAGSQIHVYARIVAVADAFDAGSAPDQAGVEPPRVRVLNAMLTGPETRCYDTVVLRALLAVCPPYAPGELVTLSNGLNGVVVGWDAQNPCRPRVMRFDPQRPWDHAEEPVHDLALMPGVCVVQSNGQDVGRDNFYPETPGAFSLDAIAKGLHTAAEADRIRAGADPAISAVERSASSSAA